jgi:hypothetical protein
MKIRNVVFTSAEPNDVQTGLLGWISFGYGSLKIDGVALRRTLGGRLALSFPARTDRCGRRHFVICPRDDETRREIEQQIFLALGMKEGPA